MIKENKSLQESDELLEKKHNDLFIEPSVLEGQSASFLQETPVFILVTISPCFLSPPPFGASATGRDSLESKVTFIQLRE